MAFIHISISTEGEIKKEQGHEGYRNKHDLSIDGLMGKPRHPYVWHVDCNLPCSIIDQGRLVFASDYPYSGAIATIWSSNEPLVSIVLLSGQDRYNDDIILNEFLLSLPENLRILMPEIQEKEAEQAIYSVGLSTSTISGFETALASVFFNVTSDEIGYVV